MRTGILLFVVLVAALALGALLWWRFKGSGRPVALPVAPIATRNHHSLPLFHYERPGVTLTQPTAAAGPPTPGSALASLLPEEDFRAQEAAVLQAEADQVEAAQAESREQAKAKAETASPEPTPDETPTTELVAEAEAPRSVSSRHAAGAVAALLDTLDEAPAPETGAAPTPPNDKPVPAPDEEPAVPALFYNPVTAPAPTANDQANRAAEIALRKQRRASMTTDTAAQRDALQGLFTGAAGKPVSARPS